MILKSIKINNFKAIKECEIFLTDATILVGTNNAGKSSILQAIHFASRLLAQATKLNQQSTLSLSQIEYIPSSDYRELAHNGKWGNFKGSNQTDISFSFIDDDNENAEYTASIEIKSARNEGISIHPQVPQRLNSMLRSSDKLFSSYIPGIAGIPLEEQVISKMPIFRKAASGDSNVVLRNILLLIKKQNKIDNLLEIIREIYPGVTISVSFDENSDLNIKCNVIFEAIQDAVEKPIEFSGTGFLQVLQIVSYLILFESKIILIDEPESHLHPTLQTKLVRVLQNYAQQNDAVVLITTHSPFVARGLSIGSRTVWIGSGKVKASSESSLIRDALGWGALDKPILLCTEDGTTKLLNNIIDQNEGLADKVSIFKFEGISKLGNGKLLDSMKKELGNNHKIIVHRDRDCMSEKELSSWRKEFEKFGFKTWVTAGSDIESYYCDFDYLSSILGLSLEDIDIWFSEIKDEYGEEFKTIFYSKRKEVNKKLYEKIGGSPSTDDLWENLDIREKYLGKKLISKLRSKAQVAGYNEKLIGKTSEDKLIASDLLDIIDQLI